MWRHWTRLLALPLLLLAGACGDDGPTGPSDVTGTYLLQTVAGQGLPYTLQSGEDYTLELLGSTLELAADRTLSETASYRATTGAEVELFEETSTGSYTHSGTRMTLTVDDVTLDGTASATRIIVGGILVYQKQ